MPAPLARLRALCLALPAAVEKETWEAAPERFFVPPYVGHKGWIGIRLRGAVVRQSLPHGR
jgi:hypothetical protein